MQCAPKPMLLLPALLSSGCGGTGAGSAATTVLLRAGTEVRGGASCTTASDCGLLGGCAAGLCACDSGFTGEACTLPDLAAAKPPGENALFSQSSHSWGGKPIRNPDGKTWSLFAAAMTEHCPLSSFNNNSAIRRAVSTSPGGPFTGGEIVFPPFAHNPTVTTAPDGTILLFYIGAPEHRQINCSGTDGTASPFAVGHGSIGRDRGGIRVGAQQPTVRWKPQTDIINMAWSKSPSGPWQTRVVVPPAKPTDNQTAWNCHASNPSPIVLPSGKILLMYRGTPCDLAGAKCNNAWECVRQGIADAPNFRGDFTKRSEPLGLVSTSEDGFFWHSKRGFHLITHSWRTCGEPSPRTPDTPNRAAGSCGAYSWSEDGTNWTSSAVPFYEAAVRWENGSTTELRARQRPQIVFDDRSGAPLFLFNGVTSIEGGVSRSWTMGVPFTNASIPLEALPPVSELLESSRGARVSPAMKLDDEEDPTFVRVPDGGGSAGPVDPGWPLDCHAAGYETITTLEACRQAAVVSGEDFDGGINGVGHWAWAPFGCLLDVSI